MKHLPRGGSVAKRQIMCPGSLAKSEGIAPRPAGEAAITGSMHHEVQEKCRREDKVPNQMLGHPYIEGGVTRTFEPDDLDLADIMYAATDRVLNDYDIDEFEIEPFVEFIPGVSGGSIDLLGLSEDHKTILIHDYKTGTSKVPVEGSEQHGVYALASRVDPKTKDMWSDVERVVFVIVQPRIKGVVFRWETDIAWLDRFEQTYRKAMTLTTINPGTHCKYCPAEPYCEEKRLNIMATNLLDARHQDELNAAAAMVVEVEDWAKSTKEEMYLQMVRGVPIKGWKIVEKRVVRTWGDEDEAAKGIKLPRKDMFKTTLLSPAQMEKVVKRKKVNIDLNKFIISVSPGMTIAKDDDSREAVIVGDVQGELKEMMK
jgi:hypothetical protein